MRKYNKIDYTVISKYRDKRFVKIIEPAEPENRKSKYQNNHQTNAVKLRIRGSLSHSDNANKNLDPDIPSHVVDKAYSNIELLDEIYKFDTSMSPYAAFNAFVYCIKHGYYPPIEILNFLCHKLTKYLESNRSLDDIFNTKLSTKSDYNIDTRNTNIILEIDILKYHFGIKANDAFDAVSSRYINLGIQISPGAVNHIYYHNKHLFEKSLKLDHDDFCILEEDDDDVTKKWRKEFIDQYPEPIKVKLIRDYKWIDKNGLLSNVTPNYNKSRFKQSLDDDEYEDNLDD